MTRNRHITPVAPVEPAEIHAEIAPDGDILTLDEEASESSWEDDLPAPFSRDKGWILPALAFVAVLGWSGFFGWAHQQAMLAGASPAQWGNWITSWAVPVLLVATLWLLAMRNSRREAGRFVDSARALAEESARLEQRLTTN